MMQAENIGCGRADEDAAAHIDVPRRRGAQPGNCNRHIHGRCSRAYREARKLACAKTKMLNHIAHMIGAIPDESRARWLRPDQIELLLRHDPKLLRVAERLDVPGVRAFLPLIHLMARELQRA